MNSVGVESYWGNLVTITTMYVAGACHTKKASYQYDLNKTQDKRVIYVTLWLPWQPSYHNNEVHD